MKSTSLTIALIVAGICTLGVISVSAQSPFTVNYFANNGTSGAPDATVRVTNPGTAIGEVMMAPTTNGNLCAMMYVFDNDQQMSECCGCITTPDGLRTFSVTKDLTSNPLTGVVSKNGDIKIFATYAYGPTCDPTGELEWGPEGILRAWATHIQNKVGTGYPVTETAFSDAQISAGEISSLEGDCYFINRLGSGHGICSCGTGD